MADTFQVCLAFTLSEEGGWSDNPNDPGGCTMRGITLPSYRAWRHDGSLTCNDLLNLSSNDVSAFYEQSYWYVIRGAELPLGVDLMVMDAAVNMGCGRSVKILQGQLGVAADGKLGPVTLGAANGVDAVTLVQFLAIAQMAFYRSLPDYAIFGGGWTSRVNARLEKATSMMSTS